MTWASDRLRRLEIQIRDLGATGALAREIGETNIPG